MLDISHLRLDAQSATPIYKQLADAIARQITGRELRQGDQLPPMRELATQLGLHRDTVSAAYSMLEKMEMIECQVGRGTFVSATRISPPLDFDLSGFSFSTASPKADEFPLAEFRRTVAEVLESPEAPSILQLGSVYGYPPLRRYLLENSMLGAGNDVLITSGCQQALGLLARVLSADGPATVAVEDPGYHGMLRAFSRAGCQIYSIPLDNDGMDLRVLETVLVNHRPRAIVVTPTFQNPTGLTMPLNRRQRLLDLASRYSTLVVEIDVYSRLRYHGKPVPSLKELDARVNVLLLRSFSKISFPGLRVGWAIGPKNLIGELAENKEITDIHSDQLSQAILLRFAQSGELARHIERTCVTGGKRMWAAMHACSAFLPMGTRFTRPEGGMNFWVELPRPLTAEALLARVEPQGVTFVPGNRFSSRDRHERAFRLSFAGMKPEEIRRGIEIIGAAVKEQLEASKYAQPDPAPALV